MYHDVSVPLGKHIYFQLSCVTLAFVSTYRVLRCTIGPGSSLASGDCYGIALLAMMDLGLYSALSVYWYRVSLESPLEELLGDALQDTAGRKSGERDWVVVQTTLDCCNRRHIHTGCIRPGCPASKSHRCRITSADMWLRNETWYQSFSVSSSTRFARGRYLSSLVPIYIVFLSSLPFSYLISYSPVSSLKPLSHQPLS